MSEMSTRTEPYTPPVRSCTAGTRTPVQRVYIIDPLYRCRTGRLYGCVPPYATVRVEIVMMGAIVWLHRRAVRRVSPLDDWPTFVTIVAVGQGSACPQRRDTGEPGRRSGEVCDAFADTSPIATDFAGVCDVAHSGHRSAASGSMRRRITPGSRPQVVRRPRCRRMFPAREYVTSHNAKETAAGWHLCQMPSHNSRVARWRSAPSQPERGGGMKDQIRGNWRRQWRHSPQPDASTAGIAMSDGNSPRIALWPRKRRMSGAGHRRSRSHYHVV
jgi:hypothetical protein